jgi:hypothetical protein
LLLLKHLCAFLNDLPYTAYIWVRSLRQLQLAITNPAGGFICWVHLVGAIHSQCLFLLVCHYVHYDARLACFPALQLLCLLCSDGQSSVSSRITSAQSCVILLTRHNLSSGSMPAGSHAASAPPPLPPDIYNNISRLLPDAASRAALFATCTAARDGVLSSCHSIQVTLLGSTSGLTQCASLLNLADSKGLLKQEALGNITLKLQVRSNKTPAGHGTFVVCPCLIAALMLGQHMQSRTHCGFCVLVHTRGCIPGPLKPLCMWQLHCPTSRCWC